MHFFWGGRALSCFPSKWRLSTTFGDWHLMKRKKKNKKKTAELEISNSRDETEIVMSRRKIALSLLLVQHRSPPPPFPRLPLQFPGAQFLPNSVFFVMIITWLCAITVPPSSRLCFPGIETISSETRSKNPVYLPTFPFYILDLWFLLLLFFFTLKSINKNEQQMRNGRTVGRQLKESFVAIQIQNEIRKFALPAAGILILFKIAKALC